MDLKSLHASFKHLQNRVLRYHVEKLMLEGGVRKLLAEEKVNILTTLSFRERSGISFQE